MNKGGVVEPAGSPVDQECSGVTLAEPRVDEAASMDVACSGRAALSMPWWETVELMKISWQTRHSAGGCAWPIIVSFVLFVFYYV